MVNSEDQPHPAAVEVPSDNDCLHPISYSSNMGPVPAFSLTTQKPPQSIQQGANSGLDCANLQSASGLPDDVHSCPPNGRRVRFDHQVHHNSDIDAKGSSPTDQSTFVDTPPKAIFPYENSNLSESDIDSRPGHGMQRQKEVEEVEEYDIGMLSPLPRSKHPTRRKVSFEKEVRAALERVPGGEITLQDRKKLMTMLGSYSAPVSAQVSPTLTPRTSLEGETRNGPTQGCKEPLRISPEELEKGVHAETVENGPREDRTHQTVTTEAHKLVRAHTQKCPQILQLDRKKSPRDLESGASSPVDEEMGIEQIRSGVLTTLLKLYNAQNPMPYNHQPSVPTSFAASGRTTPKWYNKNASCSVTSLVGFRPSSSSQTLTSSETHSGPSGGAPSDVRIPKTKRGPSGAISDMLNKFNKPSIAEEIKITIHIAKLLSRQKYVLKLCRALMLYGAPTHRLEEYVKMTCAILEIDAQCLYIPGCMVISFDDPSTHTSDMRIVRVNQGCDLSKLHDTHLVYKAVVHDLIGVEEATSNLEDIINRPPQYPAWMLVFVYGLASALVGPFAFQARPIDMPISFLLGCILGILQLIVAPKSDIYTNVLEISASIIMSFLARMFGSLYGGELFCFSALAQSSIALILPGYIILCGSLELQSKNLVAGSVRMFYSIIYSLFLGFGITVGAALYGAIDPDATSATTCRSPMARPWSFLFVPLFAMCLLVANQATWRQAPVMIAIATLGYTVNYFSMERFANNPQVVSALGALAIGISGNLYSRIGHGLAFAAMLPAVFVQVPSGLAAQGSIVSGIQNADALAKGNIWHSQDVINSTVLNLGFSMIQVSIGLTVGLFTTVLLLYPFGKQRSGLFTF